MTRIGFTGTRHGITNLQAGMVKAILETLHPNEVHHGDCKGGDEQFHQINRELGTPRIVAHPCDIEEWRAFCEADEIHDVRPPLVRNSSIVGNSDILLACPQTEDEVKRSGTWYTWREAKRKGVWWVLIKPDGTFDSNHENIWGYLDGDPPAWRLAIDRARDAAVERLTSTTSSTDLAEVQMNLPISPPSASDATEELTD